MRLANPQTEQQSQNRVGMAFAATLADVLPTIWMINRAGLDSPITIIIHQTMDATISLAQIQIQVGLPEKNFQTAKEMIARAADEGSELVLLPELWTSGYDLPNCARYSTINLELLTELKVIAANRKISIGGSYITRADGGFQNTFILVTPHNFQPPSYHKIHPFRLLNEEQWFLPGSELVTVEFPWGKAGLSICYDLRFPEMFRKYALLEASCLLNVSQWGYKRTEHWRTLLRARAIENQYFVAAVNACGLINQDTLAGYSAIINPWGEPMIEANASDEVLLTTRIDLEQVAQVRKMVPAQEDGRTDLYRTWL